MNLANLAADILLAPYGKSHVDLAPDDVTPEPQHTGEYELFNTTTAEVEAVTVLTAKQATKLNDELRAENDDRRWVEFCPEESDCFGLDMVPEVEPESGADIRRAQGISDFAHDEHVLGAGNVNG